MGYSRRSFLKQSAFMAGGIAAGTLPFLKACSESGTAPSSMAFGLQLYTLRDVISDDPEGVIGKVASYGYNQIESYDGPLGIFWGMKNTDFKFFLDNLELSMVSSHVNTSEDFDRKAGELAEIGAKYIISPYVGPQESLDDFKRIADTFNEFGDKARQYGIRFAYHNHAYSFEKMDGIYPQDVLMQNTNPDTVDYQLDIYWVVAAGEDPVEWIKKYPGRFVSGHVKDLDNSGEEPESTVLGTGTIDFPSVLRVARENGMEHFIVEQEAYTNTTPLDAVKANADFMKDLRL